MPQDTPRLPFEIDETIDPTLVTGRAGVPLVIELFRHLGVAQAIDAEVAVIAVMSLLPAMLAAARGAVFNGIPPYDLWEHPPALGKIPPHGSDAGSYLVGEVFGARMIVLLKDVDGLYTADPKTHPGAEFIPSIRAADLIGMQLPTLPIEPVVLKLLMRAKLATSIRIINGLVPGNLSRALAGEPVGSVISA